MAVDGEELIGNMTQFKKEDFENEWIPIALGGFGKVYKVRHKKWWSVYAVKCSTAFYGDPELDSTTYRSLMEEASKMEKIKFRYIIQIYGICINPLGIVMEYMENGSLEKLIPTHTLSWLLKFRIIHEIALGMNFLHIMSPPLLHLDLKPGNILLDEHLHVKISDFGLSKWKENSTRKEYIERSAIKGTLSYIPPEVFLESSRVPGIKYDVYSFSIVMWELLTQKKPFIGNSMMTVIIKVAAGQRPPLEDISENRPVECQQMIDLMKRCWNQDPSKRPSFSDVIVESHMLLCLVQSPLPEHEAAVHKAEDNPIKASTAVLHDGSSDNSIQPSTPSSLSRGTDSLLNQLQTSDMSWVDENNFTMLHFAVSEGNFERVNHFLTLNANVNSQTVSGSTPLILAVQRKLLDICACLIENGADVNITDKDKWSPLHFAAQGGDDRIVRLLLDHGADVDALEQDDWTPLHLASQNGFENVARVLFTRQSNPNSQEIDGRTPLHVASCYGHYNIVKLLISQGAELDSKQKDYRTPLHIASDRGCFRVVQHLIQKGAQPNSVDHNYYTPLHMAVVKGKSLICKHLIKHGAQVNLKTIQGWTPLHLATYKGHTDIIHLLKDNDAKVDAVGHMQWTPLHMAVRYSAESMISLLLDMGADPNVTEISGWTPLHFAVYMGSFCSVIKLIESKADVDAQNMFGWTPLHVAVLNANAAIVKTLLRANAKQNIEDSSGCTPLQLAIRNQKDHIISLLEGGTDTSSSSSAEDNLGPFLNFQE